MGTIPRIITSHIRRAGTEQIVSYGCVVDCQDSADLWIVLVDPNTYVYYNASVQRNQEAPKYISEYSTDYVTKSSLAFLEEALEADG